MLAVQKLNRLLPLVAIGTVADAQSLLEVNNRLLVKAGLSIIQKQNHQITGLHELIKQTGYLEKIQQGYNFGSQDIAFSLSPILNSSGRLSHASLSIKCLLADLDNKQDLLLTLIQTNVERKAEVKKILEEVETQALAQSKEALIWLQGSWHKGIIGLLASRLVSKYNKPCVVIGLQDDGLATASLRAPEGYHLPQAMDAAKQHLLKYGGHPCAAGFSAKTVELSSLCQIMKSQLSKQAEQITFSGQKYIPEDLLELAQKHNLDQKLYYQKNLIWLRESELDITELSQITKLEPFGQYFEYPEFMILLEPGYNLQFMGPEGQHLRIQSVSGYSFVKFNLDPEFKTQILAKAEIWIHAKLNQNLWNNKIQWQFLSVD